MLPESGTSPSFAKACRNVALRAANVMSQASARLMPAPAATPFTAPTIGSSSERIRLTSGL